MCCAKAITTGALTNRNVGPCENRPHHIHMSDMTLCKFTQCSRCVHITVGQNKEYYDQ